MRGITLRSRLERQLSQAEAAYVAGIIDGEGTLSLSGFNRRQTELSIANTHKPLMDWLCAIIPGSVYYTAGREPPCKTIYSWRFRGQLRIYDLLCLIEPYMIVKRELAQRMISHMRNWLSFYLDLVVKEPSTSTKDS